MNTYIIELVDDFNKYYTLLESSARFRSNPDIYVVGFDTESIGKKNYPQSFEKSKQWILDNTTCDVAVCKVQIATENICLLIDLCKLGPILPNNLIKIMKSESWIKAGVGISQDLQYLSYNYKLGHCNGGFELKTIAQLADIKTPNLACIYSLLTNDYTVKNKNHTGDWSFPLTDEQEIVYAAKDAYMSYKSFMSIAEYIVYKLKNDKISKESFEIKVINKNIDIVKSEISINSPTSEINYVGLLQEYCQKNNKPIPIYEESNGSINADFTIKCLYDSKQTIGIGRAKKLAKQIAAENMYKSISLF